MGHPIVTRDHSISERRATKTPRWLDGPLLAAELAARQVYWRLPRLRAWVKRRRACRRHAPQVADRGDLKEYLRGIGVAEGALVMAHTSTLGLSLREGPNSNRTPANPLLVARQLLDDLLELVGDSGTLVMPTHAAYQSSELNVRGGKASPAVVYDPAKTPCDVGLVNELFWRSPGVLRSLYPYNMLAARGPLAAELLHNNLNDRKPLPHGVDSGYYRFCQRDGLVVSVGVPLGRCITLIHTAEETRDRKWPIKDFFEERQYIVQVEGRRKTCIVRQRRPEYGMFCLCLRKLRRDLVAAGVLHEGTVGTVQVDWARSREVFEHLMARNANAPYPYYWTSLISFCC